MFYSPREFDYGDEDPIGLGWRRYLARGKRLEM